MNPRTNNIQVVDLTTEDEATLIIRRNVSSTAQIPPDQQANPSASNTNSDPDVPIAPAQQANEPAVTVFRARPIFQREFAFGGPSVSASIEHRSLYDPQPSLYAFKLNDVPDVSTLKPRPGFKCDLDLVKCPCCLDEVPRYQCYLFNCDHRVCIVNGCAQSLIDARCPICRLDVRNDKEGETIKASLELEAKRKREDDEILEKQILLAIAESLKEEAKAERNDDSSASDDEFFIETRVIKRKKNGDLKVMNITTEPFFGRESSPMMRAASFSATRSPRANVLRDSFFCVIHGANRINCTCKEPAV